MDIDTLNQKIERAYHRQLFNEQLTSNELFGTDMRNPELKDGIIKRQKYRQFIGISQHERYLIKTQQPLQPSIMIIAFYYHRYIVK